jgi:ribosome-binding factor A
MPRDFPRSRRVEDQVQRILSEVLRVDVRDPRLHGAIITAVDVSRDLSVAWVYYSSLDGNVESEDLQAALVSATGFLRGQLARQLTVRQVPELRFRHDDSLQRGADMDRLIDEAVARDHRDSESADDDEE